MRLGRATATVVAVSLVAIGGLFLPTNQTAAQAAPNNNPCEKINLGEVKYPSHGASHVTFATSSRYGVSNVLITGCVLRDGLYVQEWQTTGHGGSKGFAPPGKMWEDTWMSPTGSFTFTEALGRSNPGTSLAYHTVNRNSRWGGEYGPTYNQYFEGAGGPSDENLYTYMNQGYYEQAAVINWNRQPDMPVTQGASYAIFFHAGNVPSAGCISTDLGTVNRLLRTNRPGDRIIMGVESEVFKEPTTRIGFVDSNGLLNTNDNGWVAQMHNVKEQVVTQHRTGVLLTNGEFYAKEGSPYASWKLLAHGVKDIALTEARTAYVADNGNLYANEGPIDSSYIHESSGVKEVKLASDRLGYLSNSGELVVKQGSLYSSWAVMTGGVVDFDMTSSRVGIVGTNGTASVKEGNLHAGWVTEANGVRSIELSGARIGVLGTDGNLFVKEGSLYSSWVHETGGVKDFELSGNRIGIIGNDSISSMKSGSLYAGWTGVASSAQSISFS